jgi:hypothetical protein
VAEKVGFKVTRIKGSTPRLPLSEPFDIRCAPDLTSEARQHIEAQFDLVVIGPNERDPRHRTYQYRLPNPTRARIRALLAERAVEDTAHIDAQRGEIH